VSALYAAVITSPLCRSFTTTLQFGNLRLRKQGLYLEHELYGPVSKLQILRFQSLEQVPVEVRSPAGPAGPRKLENGSGFLPVRNASASYPTH
jgi:hypothetical protein